MQQFRTSQRNHISKKLDIDEQPRKRIFLNDHKRKKDGTKKSTLCRDLLRHLRLHVGGSLNEILHDLVTLILAGGLDLLQLLLGLLVRIVLVLLETARVLQTVMSARFPCAVIYSNLCIKRLGLLRLTSASNFLNSSSFCLRYSSISFWASDLASLIRLVRSVARNVNYRTTG